MKEAVTKAFGTGVGPHISWLDIEVVEEHRYPARHRSSSAAGRESSRDTRRAGDILISLSHTKNYAVAHALLLGKPNAQGTAHESRHQPADAGPRPEGQRGFRIPGDTLMDRAGFGVAERSSNSSRGFRVRRPLVPLLAGRGNNGGNAFVAARYLKERDYEVEVLLAGEAGAVGGRRAEASERTQDGESSVS